MQAHRLDDARPLPRPERFQEIPGLQERGSGLAVVHGLVVAVGAETLELGKTPDVVQKGRGQMGQGRFEPLPGHDPDSQGVDAQGVVALEDDVFPPLPHPVRILPGQTHEPGAQAPHHGDIHQMPW